VELASLVVARGVLDDDVPAVEGVDEGNGPYQGGELLLVVVCMSAQKPQFE
jgi:hypothetical protein